MLGTDVYGTAVSEQQSFLLLDTYLELGGNTIDTARMYGIWHKDGYGKSEETIGKWLKEKGGRDKIIISTKCAHPPYGKKHIHRLSQKEIIKDVEESLTALKTDYIDILWLHRDDLTASSEEIIDTLNRLKCEGKIRYFGASNWKSNRIKSANKYASNTSQSGFAASQIKWSLAKTSPYYNDDPTLVEINNEQYNFYKSEKICVFAYASQAKGFFQKYHTGGLSALSGKAKDRYLFDENINRYNKLLDYVKANNFTISQAVIGALVSNTDFDTVAIVGCKTVDQLKDTISENKIKIDYCYFKELMGY